jgi:hypothetical protein
VKIELTDPVISERAKAIVQGLINSDRARHKGVFDQGWISLNGGRVLKGLSPFASVELQPKFIEAMEWAGR